MEQRVGSDLVAGVRAAVKHYRRRLESRRKPLALPSYFVSMAGPEATTAFEVPLGADVEADLKREADRQHVTLEQILSHAVLTYLADMDSEGRSLPLVDPPII